MVQKAFAAGEGLEVINDTGNTLYLRGTVDPSQAPGVPAPISSQYNRDNGVDTSIYLKFGPNDTDWKSTTENAGVIGTAEDGDYTDGLFQDFIPTTPTGTAVDRFNEVLASLAPSPAPNLTAISCSDVGVTAKLSFGASNPIVGYTNVTAAAGGSVLDINDTFTASTGLTRGVFNGSVTINGVLNDQVTASGQNYPDDAFGPGDSGILKLEVNGVVVHSVDLSTFASGDTFNVNGSGFTLSASTPVKFESGDDFDQFQYRVGTWTVDPADQTDGHNYIRVSYFDTNDNWTNYFEWVNDSDSTAPSASSELLDALAMSGSKYLSGVKYYTSGTAQYDVILSSVHRNVYSPLSNAVTYTETNCSVPNSALGNITTEADDEVITNAPVTVASNGRLLDAPITVSVNCDLPLKANLIGGGVATIPGLLLDGVNTANTDVNENFCLEDYRLISVANTIVNDYATQADIANGTWDSTQDISNTGALGYADGMLVYNGAVRQPKLGLDAGDFRNVADGNTNGPENGPVGNPNYSAVTGIRYYYREFINNTGLTKANLKIRFTGTGTFVPVSTGPSSNNITAEIKFPDGAITTGTGWLDMYEDFATNQWADGDGARNATAGAGRAMGVDWGLTVGTKSIAAGESVIVRIAVNGGYTGEISDILVTWL